MGAFHSIDSLAIEITRQCNMRCRHCFRGHDPQDTEFSAWHALGKQLNKIDTINTLTITGGEPAMNVEGINLLLILLNNCNVRVGATAIVTNATVNMDKLLVSYAKYYDYCSEHDECILGISNTQYHQEERNRLWLEAAYEEYNGMANALKGYKNIGTRESIVGEGNAKLIVGNHNNNVIIRDAPRPSGIEISEIDGDCVIGYGSVLYIDSSGNMFSSCDLAYNTQALCFKEKNQYYVGTLYDDMDIITMVGLYNRRIEKETI